MADQITPLSAAASGQFGVVSKPSAGLVSRGSGGLMDPPVRLMNVLLDRVTQSRCIDAVINGLQQGCGGWVITLNLDHLRRCWSDPLYETCVREADLRVADGMPLLWASRLQRTPLPERVAGSDLIFRLPEALAEHGRSIFLLGGDPGTADAAGDVLASKYPGLVVAGTYCPPLGFEHQLREWDRIRALLLETQPDVVLVALGSPKQEYLIRRLRPLLPGAWWMGVGISFSFACGQVKRAPHWMQRSGLEWIHRMVQEPRRLARRYLSQGIPFGLLLLFGAVLRRENGAEATAAPKQTCGATGSRGIPRMVK